ncbi:hypothetical protein WICPIJ_004560 [Wickerhamomyces pijperi]|uniref:Uncharacterized protein n=1 Tax=Wickerhamomyces pijperi TaxID=599730 RepID=A0A9P8TMM8_WICPI|nr:hypothetical protein WICPIJ_004560 [Wickerhamomyces pijperi]
MISDNGDQIKGPRENPKTIKEQVKVDTSVETWYWSLIKPNPPVTQEDPKATEITKMESTMVYVHLFQEAQLCGFSGSLVINVTNSISSSSSGSSSFFSSFNWLVLVLESWVWFLPMDCNVVIGTKPVEVSSVYSSGKIGFLMLDGALTSRIGMLESRPYS